MEPMNCTALVTDDGFEVWASTQAPENALDAAAEAAGLPVSEGNLHVTQIGGGFGRRLELDYVAQAVQIAKAMKGTPIKLIWSREDTTRHGFYRPPNLSRLRGAIDSHGNATAWSHRIVATSSSVTLGLLGATRLPYPIPNILVDLVVKQCHVPEGKMRAVGLAAQGFFTQCFMDELARAAGTDSYRYQRTLLDPERIPETASKPHKISPKARVARLRAVLDEAARKSNWDHPLGRNRGRGIAALQYADAFFAVVVEVTLDGKGWFSADRVVVAADTGFLVNPDIADAQVEGSVAFGLTSALYGEITIDKGSVVQANFNDYRILRVDEMPKVETHWVLSRQGPWGGLGEPVVAAVVPALVNAIYDAGGPRIRALPLKNHEILPRKEQTSRRRGAPMIGFTLNGKPTSVDVSGELPLLWVLREVLNLTGTKYGCGIGACGACTVHINGRAQYSCLTAVSAISGRSVTTIEGLSAQGQHPLQRAWIAEQVPQCGYCQSGQIMKAAELLAKIPRPTRDQIVAHMAGNICRCGTYARIVARNRACGQGHRDRISRCQRLVIASSLRFELLTKLGPGDLAVGVAR